MKKNIFITLLITVMLSLTLSALFAGTALGAIAITSPTQATVAAESSDFAIDEFSDPWDFSQTDDYRLEDAGDIANLGINNGVISGQTSGNDPNFFVDFPGYLDAWPNGRDGMRHPIDTSKYRYLSVRIYSSASTIFQVYWFYNQTWTSYGYATHSLNPGWNTFRIDLGANSGWTGRPVGLRVDPASQSGVDFQIDWLKLHQAPTAANNVTVSWDDTAPGGTADIYLDNDVNPDNGNLGLIGSRASNASNNWTWDASDQPAGTYYIYARKSGVNSAAAGPFELRSPPLIKILDPDAAGGEDFATALNGDPWDMNSTSDLSESYNMQNLSANGILSGTNTNSDPNFYLRVDAPIDTNRYHRITFTMAYDPPFDFGQGSMARFIWNPIGHNDTTYQTSDDIVVYPQWHEYNIDLKKIKLDGGSLGWNGMIPTLRFDPLEIFNIRNFQIGDIYLRADDEAITNFPIKWQDLRNSPPATTVSIYYDTDNKDFNGTLIAQNITQSNGVNTYNWDVTQVPAGTYYIYIVANDGVTTSRHYSSGPVKIPGAAATVWNSGRGNWDWAAGKVVSGDFNGDGYSDVAVLYGYVAQRDVRLFVFPGSADGFLPPQEWWHAGAGSWDWAGSMLTAGDYNGDNKDDIGILYGYAAQRDVKTFVFPSTGSSFAAPQMWWDSGPGNWDWVGSKLTSGDYNGDKKDDMAVLYGYAAQHQSRAFIFTSNGTNAFNKPTAWWDSGPGNWDWVGSKLTSGDYNGDKKDDMAVLYGYAREHQTRAFVFIAGSDTFNLPTAWWDSGPGNWDWSGSKLTSGDYNGDKKDDLGVLYGYGGGHSAVYDFSSTGRGNFSAPSTIYDSRASSQYLDANTGQTLSGDFNNDGREELASFYNLGSSQSKLYLFR